jgi:hypothetical protein
MYALAPVVSALIHPSEVGKRVGIVSMTADACATVGSGSIKEPITASAAITTTIHRIKSTDETGMMLKRFL